MIHNLSILTFPSAPHHHHHHHHARCPAAKPRRAPKVNRLLRTLELNSCFFSKISAHASGAWCHSHLLVLFPIWGFILTSVNDASSPHAREHLRSCLHQTNPCTKRKVLILTKPKGKIYKTKSFGHYTTILRSLSDKYSSERYEPPYLPSYGLNSTNTVLLEIWIWH